ncbi:Hsp20/alpha crystallin family protein [Polyangium sp. rjm3]|uniref:Hsp20/alpha crystallin family protein n=1 Tax=Polyangium mundeleinium TaxID=2995306 RepID=A0ABT5F7C4_9BACT|nr:Hsp20/alpha crystallin family protein [Polyangium mundeleinium]MDC0749022.1 Hsp20/alpha crystallin family protein [Polyangium mundeleinium]
MAGFMRKREGREGQGPSREMTQAGAREPRREQRLATADPFRSLGYGDPFRRMREMLAWDPFAEMESFLPQGRAFMPDMEVRETKDGYAIRADLPGLKEDDISIDVSGRRLTISGRREEEQRDENERYWAYERSYGSFTRSFTLPEGIDPERIDANLSNGVLEVLIPKSKAEEPKRISVRRGEARAEEQGAQSSVRPQTSASGASGTGASTTAGQPSAAGGGAAGTHGTSQATTGAGGSEQGMTQGGSREKAA